MHDATLPATLTAAGSGRDISASLVRPATLTEGDAAVYLGVSKFTLRQSRVRVWTKAYRQFAGPPFLKLGRNVRYRLADLDAWLDAHRVERPASPVEVRHGA